MQLEGSERMALLEILTNQPGNYEFLRNIQRARELIDFTPNEILKLGLRRSNGQTFYDAKALTKLGKDIPLDGWVTQFLHDKIKAISDQNKLREQDISLYEKFVPEEVYLPELDAQTATRLRQERKGKKTVAIVGFANESVTLAPYGEPGVEIWGLNEAHAFSWMKRAHRWFQLHDSYKSAIAKRGISGHHEWLKENKWNIPIYMMQIDPEIPRSTAYPIDDVCALTGKVKKGDETVRYFNSTFDYMMGLAILEGFERIEVYGVHMKSEGEYEYQRPGAAFWIGLATGKGIEIYLPPVSPILKSNLYGGIENVVE